MTTRQVKKYINGKLKAAFKPSILLHLVTKWEYLQFSFVFWAFSVFIDQVPASIPHFSASHVWCLVISQGFRLSLEDPDTGHENGHEPKLTIAGTAGQQQEQQTNPWSLLRRGSVCWEGFDLGFHLVLFVTQHANLDLEFFTHVLFFIKT